MLTGGEKFDGQSMARQYAKVVMRNRSTAEPNLSRTRVYHRTLLIDCTVQHTSTPQNTQGFFGALVLFRFLHLASSPGEKRASPGSSNLADRLTTARAFTCIQFARQGQYLGPFCLNAWTTRSDGGSKCIDKGIAYYIYAALVPSTRFSVARYCSTTKRPSGKESWQKATEC